MNYTDEEVYPCTIIRDRYDGTYSGGEWIAVRLDFWDDAFQNDLSDIDGSDVECQLFWNSELPQKYIIGKGLTPQNAIEDMVKELRKLRNGQ